MRTTMILPDETWSFLRRLAYWRNTTMSELVRDAVEHYYADGRTEIAERERALEEAMARYNARKAAQAPTEVGESSAETGS